jgi:hypothetical protein
MQVTTVRGTGFEALPWSHRKQRRHHQGRNTACQGMQLGDMMQEMEIDLGCCWVQKGQ